MKRGEHARALPHCDLVMKGGITSGVVYPGAVLALARDFRFAAVGGTSAGAIAAGVCAAGEYGRIRDEGSGLEQLDVIAKELSQPGFLTGLFQATSDTKPLMDLALLPADHPDDGRVRRTLRLGWAACRRAPLACVAAAVPLIAFAALAWEAFADFPLALAVALTLVAAVPVTALVLAATLAVAFALPLRRALRSLEKSNFGACPGTSQPGYPAGQRALTEWLHAHVQTAAGRAEDSRQQVLTVADLADAEDKDDQIRLETMTTDLSRARPLRCPADLDGYSFKPSELREVFPEPVLARLIEPDRGAPDPSAERLASDELCPLVASDLPVLVAIRLSLSFPGLLSAVPLYRENGGGVRRSLFSDGGIASNFPLHFFDAWFPRRPTFGIDLGPLPSEGAPLVVMHGEGGEADFRAIDGIPAFGGQIKDTMQNWRDNLQAELPGYSDRVCDVRFKPGEGGLNLKMKPPAIAALMDRGRQAGERLATALPMKRLPEPPTPEWLGHCTTRFRTLMSLQQKGLCEVQERSADFLAALDAGGLTPGREEWAHEAVRHTRELLDCADKWGEPPKEVDFAITPPPEPEPVMRVVPRA